MFETFKLRSRAVQENEEVLRELISDLTDTERKLFYERFSERVKDPDTYAVLNFFVVTGFHHFYLRKYIHGFINLFFLLFGILKIFSVNEDGQWQGSIGLGIIMLILLIEIPALLRSQIIVKDYNNRLAHQTLLDIKESIPQ